MLHVTLRWVPQLVTRLVTPPSCQSKETAMFHRLLVPSLFIAALLAGPTLAQKPPVSPEEQLKQLLQRFPEADANRDGTLTREEA